MIQIFCILKIFRVRELEPPETCWVKNQSGPTAQEDPGPATVTKSSVARRQPQESEWARFPGEPWPPGPLAGLSY